MIFISKTTMANFNSEINPTSNECVSSGYSIGDTWFNKKSYTRYTQTSDGVWTENHTESGKLITNVDTCKFYFINGQTNNN